MKYYVVQTYTNAEKAIKRQIEERKVGKSFESLIGEVLVPSEEITERRGKNEVKTSKKFFPGYVFVEMELTSETQHFIKNLPRVTGFLGGTDPKPVSPGEMRRALGKTRTADVASADEPAGDVYSGYQPGDHAKIKTGPFASFPGVIQGVDPDKRSATILVSIFNRPTTIQVDFNQIEPTEA